MHLQLHPYSLILVGSSLAGAFVAALVFINRSTLGAPSLLWTIFGLVFWSSTYAIQWSCTTLGAQVFWLSTTFIGVYISTTGYFLFSLTFTGREKLVTRKLIFALSVVPVLGIISLITDPWFHTFYTGYEIRILDGYPVLFWGRGLGFFITTVFYTGLLHIFSALLILMEVFGRNPIRRRQGSIILLANVVPWTGVALTVTGNNPLAPLDLAPIGFTVSSALFAFAILKLRVLDLTPIAKEAVFEEWEDSVFVLEKRNRILEANHKALAFLEMGYTDVVGKRLVEILRHKKLSIKIGKEGIQESEDSKGEVYEIVIKKILEKSQSRGRIVFIRNITDKKESQKQLKIANARLEEMNAAKDTLFSVLAHDLRNPLGSFQQLTELLESEHRNLSFQERDRYLHLLRESADRLFEMLENLLSWSASQGGKIQFQPRFCRAQDLLSSVLKEAEPQAKRKEIRIQCTVETRNSLFLDPEMIGSVLRNLISNAIKFTERNHNVYIRVRDTELGTEFSVEDEGQGIDASEILKLQNLDYMEKRKGTEGEQSAGLGLLLSSEFIARHNGKLRVESEVGRGSIFYFRLPPGPPLANPMQMTTVFDDSK